MAKVTQKSKKTMSVRGSLKKRNNSYLKTATEAVIDIADVISRENIPGSSVQLISLRHRNVQ